MRANMVSKDVGVRENGAKMWAAQEYSLARPRAKLWNKHSWVRRSCWGKGVELELVNKTWARKKNSSCKFSHWFVKKCLSWIRVSLCFIAWPWGSKVKHHWGSKRSKCQVGTLYGYCTSLSNGKQNVICTSHHRATMMQLYKQRQQRPKWKDPRTSNVQT